MILPVLAMAVAATQIASAKAIIAHSVKDPGSLQYRSVKSAASGVCGEYNAKNAMGGYVGFKHFMFMPSQNAVFVFPEDDGPELLLRMESAPVELDLKDQTLDLDTRFDVHKAKSNAMLAMFDCMS